MNKSKNTKNYTKKYAKALKGVPILDYKELCVKTKNGLKKIDPLDVTFEGSSFRLILDLYGDEKNRHKDLKHSVGQASSTLISLLKDYGCDTSSIEINALIGDLNNVLMIHPNKDYIGYQLNDAGYVIGYGYDVLMVKGEQPEDFDKGYWKLVNREFILDEVLYEQMWRSL